MKKILLPFEGSNFPVETLEFVRRLNSLSPVMVTAAFVPQVDYANLWTYTGGITGGAFLPMPGEDEADLIETNCKRVEAFLKETDIRYTAHIDRLDFALPSIRKETRYTDLLALSSMHFFENISKDQPNTYMKEILHTSECPIVLLPEKAGLPGSVILAYDGSASSVYAIKQFAYLFPEFRDIPAILVHIREKRESSIPDESLIRELVSLRFSDLTFENLDMVEEEFCHSWITTRYRPWMVTGSFGRSELSRLFSKSFIARLIREHNVPLFIAHH